MKGLVHCHSENSRYDSAMNVQTLCEKAKEKGYEAVTLTDHGTLTGIDDFVKAARDTGIKPVPGVEAYVQEDGSQYGKLHLILLAKDDLGYQGIGKAVTESNRRIVDGYPRMNKEILEKYFAEGTRYHGHVIATSACIDGVLAGIFASPESLKEKINKLIRERDRFDSPDNKSYLKNLKFLENNEEKVKNLIEEKDRLSSVAKKAFKKKENALVKLKEAGKEEEYAEKAAELEREKQESKEAAEQLEEIRRRISIEKKNGTSIKAKIKDSEDSQKKYLEKQKEIDEMEKGLVPFDELYETVKKEALWYQNLFGADNFYIEIQYHGYVSEDGFEIEQSVMRSLADLAKDISAPLVGTNDVHLPDGSEESINARQIICSLRYAADNWVPPKKAGSEQLYVKTEEELREALLHVLSEEEADEALSNADAVCDRCTCNFETGEHYPKFKGLKDGETVDEALRKMAYAGIEKKYPGTDESKTWTKEKEERLETELSVISQMGYSDYFLIVQDFLNFGRKLGHLDDKAVSYLNENVKNMSLDELTSFVDNNQTLPGFVVGAGRGSAAGSLVAYLIGITNIVDPLEYDLLFERFLNKDRVSMPDVDSDFSPEIRDLVVEYCKKVYGVDSVANIVTKGTILPRGAIRNTARVFGVERNRQAYYLELADKMAKMVPSKPGTAFADCEDIIREAFAVKEDDSEEEKAYKADANELLDQSKLVEGVFLNYGMHAAGVIIADGNPIDDYVPLMRDEKSGDMKTQCNMIQAEEDHGLLKFDFLGLRNLNIVTLTLRYIYNETGVSVDVENLPFEDEVFRNIFASGNTGSVFQFESGGMKKMLKSAKPDCFEDLVALVALYRPGPMDFIPQYINAKQHPETITYLCPELESILAPTYGCIIYQEQVMQIVQKLAGFSLSQADNVRRYMGKKKMDKLAHEREAFVNGDPEREIDGCVKRGISADTANTLFDQMVEFAKYAFNKSHAASYAALSYITAWLKYHYSAEYMCAVLNCTDNIKKMPSVLKDCRDIGVKVLPPDVNKSQTGFTVVNGDILFGLNSVKGTKISCVTEIIRDREETGLYISFKDFIRRKVADKSTLENLVKAGAFDSFCDNRYAMLAVSEKMRDCADKLAAKEKDLEDKNAVLESSKDDRRFMSGYERTKLALETLNKEFSVLRIYDVPEDKQERMLSEKSVLGFFVTAHPLDGYKNPASFGCTEISSLEAGKNTVNVMGVIENLEIKARKSDNKPMAFFDLEDKTGVIRVCCFTKAFAQYGDVLEEDKVVKLSGFVNVDDDSSLDGQPSDELNFYMDEAKPLTKESDNIQVNIESIADWNSSVEAMKKRGYITTEGYPLIFFEKLNGEFRDTNFCVSPEILNDKYFSTTVKRES